MPTNDRHLKVERRGVDLVPPLGRPSTDGLECLQCPFTGIGEAAEVLLGDVGGDLSAAEAVHDYFRPSGALSASRSDTATASFARAALSGVAMLGGVRFSRCRLEGVEQGLHGQPEVLSVRGGDRAQRGGLCSHGDSDGAVELPAAGGGQSHCPGESTTRLVLFDESGGVESPDQRGYACGVVSSPRARSALLRPGDCAMWASA